MYIYLFDPVQGYIPIEIPMDAEQLLRRLGVTGRLIGFQYAVYMIERVARDPGRIQLITKRLYPETARQFHTTASAVERSIRTLIHVIWNKEDHSFLDAIAGAHLTRVPSVSDFVDMSAGFLRKLRL